MSATIVVLVDARNVLRSRWPNLAEDELVWRCRAWAAENGHCATLVFDGRAPGQLVGARDVDAACALVGTGRESADDWIARRAAELAAERRPYWLVTSDRELRERAGRAALRTIGGGGFVAALGAARR
jgi:hypothetical protein